MSVKVTPPCRSPEVKSVEASLVDLFMSHKMRLGRAGESDRSVAH